MLEAEMSSAGYDVEILTLREMEIAHCLGCFNCWVKTPGQCVVEDGSREVARAVISSDLVVFLTPVTFGGYSFELKKALDRIICLVMPFFTRIDGEVHHVPRYVHFPSLLAVGLEAEKNLDTEEIFGKLVTRNAINMHSPAHSALFVEDGQPPESIRSELQDRLRAFGAAHA